MAVRVGIRHRSFTQELRPEPMVMSPFKPQQRFKTMPPKVVRFASEGDLVDVAPGSGDTAGWVSSRGTEVQAELVVNTDGHVDVHGDTYENESEDGAQHASDADGSQVEIISDCASRQVRPHIEIGMEGSRIAIRHAAQDAGTQASRRSSVVESSSDKASLQPSVPESPKVEALVDNASEAGAIEFVEVQTPDSMPFSQARSGPCSPPSLAPRRAATYGGRPLAASTAAASACPASHGGRACAQVTAPQPSATADEGPPRQASSASACELSAASSASAGEAARPAPVGAASAKSASAGGSGPAEAASAKSAPAGGAAQPLPASAASAKSAPAGGAAQPLQASVACAKSAPAGGAAQPLPASVASAKSAPAGGAAQPLPASVASAISAPAGGAAQPTSALPASAAAASAKSAPAGGAAQPLPASVASAKSAPAGGAAQPTSALSASAAAASAKSAPAPEAAPVSAASAKSAHACEAARATRSPSASAKSATAVEAVRSTPTLAVSAKSAPAVEAAQPALVSTTSAKSAAESKAARSTPVPTSAMSAAPAGEAARSTPTPAASARSAPAGKAVQATSASAFSAKSVPEIKAARSTPTSVFSAKSAPVDEAARPPTASIASAKSAPASEAAQPAPAPTASAKSAPAGGTAQPAPAPTASAKSTPAGDAARQRSSTELQSLCRSQPAASKPTSSASPSAAEADGSKIISRALLQASIRPGDSESCAASGPSADDEGRASQSSKQGSASQPPSQPGDRAQRSASQSSASAQGSVDSGSQQTSDRRPSGSKPSSETASRCEEGLATCSLADRRRSHEEALAALEELEQAACEAADAAQRPPRSCTSAEKWAFARGVAERVPVLEAWGGSAGLASGPYAYRASESARGPPTYQSPLDPSRWLHLSSRGAWCVGPLLASLEGQTCLSSAPVAPGVLPTAVTEWEEPCAAADAPTAIRFWPAERARLEWQRARVACFEGPVLIVENSGAAAADGRYDFCPLEGSHGDAPAFRHQIFQDLWLYLGSDQRWWIGEEAAARERLPTGLVRSGPCQPGERPCNARRWAVVSESGDWKEFGLRVSCARDEPRALAKWGEARLRAGPLELWGGPCPRGPFAPVASEGGPREPPVYRCETDSGIWMYVADDGRWSVGSTATKDRKKPGTLLRGLHPAVPGSLPEQVEAWREIHDDRPKEDAGSAAACLSVSAVEEAWRRCTASSPARLVGAPEKMKVYDGLYDVVKQDAGDAPLFRHQVDRDRWVFLATDGRWWIGSQSAMERRQPHGLARSERVMPGELPTQGVSRWQVYSSKRQVWVRQDDMALL